MEAIIAIVGPLILTGVEYFKHLSCCKRITVKSLRNKIHTYKDIFEDQITRQRYDDDPTRNDIFEFVIIAYVKQSISIWNNILDKISIGEVNHANIYDTLNLEVVVMTREFTAFLEDSLKFEPAVNLINNYFSQYNKQIVANVSILTLTDKFDTIELVTILIDMHINLCQLVIVNGRVNLPCINGHFDGIVFEHKLTDIRHDFEKKEIFENLKRIFRGFENQGDIITHNHINSFHNIITDPNRGDIIVHTSYNFLLFLGYGNDELIGKIPKRLQYPGLQIPEHSTEVRTDFGYKMHENNTVIETFKNFRKNGESFQNTIVVKTIMSGGTPLYRCSLQIPVIGNEKMNEHVWKSYIDNVFIASDPPLFSTVYKLINKRFEFVTCFNFRGIINVKELNGLYIEDIVKISHGETKLYKIIHHVEESLNTVTVESTFNNGNKTFHLKTTLYINKTSNNTAYIFAIHREK